MISQRPLRRLPAAEPVGGVGEAVQVQPAGERGGHGHRRDGGRQGAGAQPDEQRARRAGQYPDHGSHERREQPSRRVRRHGPSG